MLSEGLEAFETIVSVPLAEPALVGEKVTVNVTLWFEVSVVGSVNPLTENAAPVTLAWDRVAGDPPVFVNVSDLPLLLPTWTLPKERVVGFAAIVAGVTPVPVSGILRLGFDPLEVMLMLPLAAPLAVGANSTVNVVLCPAFNVTGRVKPLRLNPLPLAVAAEMVRAVPPVLVKVSDLLELVPTCTLPKARLAGFAVSCPTATPVPEIERTTLPALVEKVTLPVKFPAPVGANVTLSEAVPLAWRVSGRARLPIVNPAPLKVAWLTVISVPPLLERVTLIV